MTVRDETADALYRAICADPDDVALRHVYADRLEELGDPRSEFVRVQLRLAEMEPWDDGYDDLRIRESELLIAHRRERITPLVHVPGILGDFANSIMPGVFARGLPENLEPAAAAFIDAHADIVASIPLRGVRLQEGPRHMPQFLDLPVLRRLRALEFVPEAGGVIGPGDARAVASCERLAGLERLSLYGHRLGPTDVRAFLSSPVLASLHTLDLTGNDLESGRAAAFAGGVLPTLTDLSLAGCGLRQPDAMILAAPWVARLKRLSLAHNDFAGDALAAGLHRHALGPGLRSLDLSGCNLGPRAATALAAALPPGVRELRLRWNRLGTRGATDLFRSPSLSGIRHLDLAGCDVGTAGPQLLASPHLGRLVRLDLSGVRLGDDAARLADAPFAATLSALDLENTGLSATALSDLAARGRFPALRRLSLAGNSVGTPAVVAMVEAEGFAGVADLDLTAFTGQGDALCAALAASPSSRRLRELSLVGNEITHRGAAKLAASPHLAGLVELRLWNNRIGDKSARSLRERFGPRVTC